MLGAPRTAETSLLRPRGQRQRPRTIHERTGIDTRTAVDRRCRQHFGLRTEERSHTARALAADLHLAHWGQRNRLKRAHKSADRTAHGTGSTSTPQHAGAAESEGRRARRSLHAALPPSSAGAGGPRFRGPAVQSVRRRRRPLAMHTHTCMHTLTHAHHAHTDTGLSRSWPS